MNDQNLTNTKIIDRTLPEILNKNNRISRLDILDYCWTVLNIGISYIEIDAKILKKLGKIPSGFKSNLIFKLNEISDVEKFVAYGLKKWVVNIETLKNQTFINFILKHKIDLKFELVLKKYQDIYQAIKLYNFKNIKSLRIVGLNNVIDDDWVNFYKDLCNKNNLEIDICPNNLFYNATATAIDGYLAKINYITGTFTGFGFKRNFAAIEEIMLAICILKDKNLYNLKLLQELRSIYCNMLKIRILEYQPVIGKNIFNFESGIHADGILKNTNNYEPFAPELIGLKRRMVIGKHSGKRSVTEKLKEFELDDQKYNIENILANIKDFCIKNKKEVNDEEFIKICQSMQLD